MPSHRATGVPHRLSEEPEEIRPDLSIFRHVAELDDELRRQICHVDHKGSDARTAGLQGSGMARALVPEAQGVVGVLL
jgi:hypothetical protein